MPDGTVDSIINMQLWAHKGPRGPVFQARPTLTVSLDALEAILYDEDGKIAPEDVPGLICNICGIALTHPYTDRAVAGAAFRHYDRQAYCGSCECAPCRCNDPDGEHEPYDD